MKLLQKANSNNGYIGNSILIFLIRVFPSLANILVVVFFSRLLDKSAYGVYQNFWVNVLLLSAIASLGIQSFIVTYTSSSIASLLKSMRVSQYLLLVSWVLLVGVVFGLLQKAEVGLSVAFAATFLSVYAFSIIFESLLTAFRKFKLLVWLSLFHTIVFGWLHWLYVNRQVTLKELFVYLLILGVIRLLPYVYVSFKEIAKHDKESHDIKAVRRLWLHIGFFEISQRLLTLVDKFIIGLLLSSELFAIYFNGTIQIPFLPLLLGAVGSAMLMQMADDSKQVDEKLIRMVAHSGQVLSAVVFPLFFFFLIYRYELFHVVFTNKYESAIPIFFVSILVLPLRAYNFTTVLQNRHRGGLINIGVFIDLLSILLLLYPLYQLFGLPGVALSFVLSSYIQGAYYLYQTGKLLKVPFYKLIPLKNWLIKLVVFGGVSIGLHYMFVQTFTEQIVLILGTVVTVVIVVLALILELKQNSNLDGQSVQKEEA
ncbi:MAG: oligosaccharide flippase family protein [Flavipsychrobacter sp.]